ncbi:MAG: UbiA family prenyltransferase [Pirellulales bacterium]|nr:UbiA family prenyltransferase [Pirellulales bacterium]
MVLALARLLRLPNLFSAWADIFLGWLVANPDWWWQNSSLGSRLQFILLLLCSSGIYLAGMVWNDIFDAKIDEIERPQRPIPAGKISLATARGLGWGLFAAGLMASVAASALSQNFLPMATAAVLALTAHSYNAVLKFTPLGPVCLGLCRALNVLLGMSTAVPMWEFWQVCIAAGLGIYIMGVTVFAAGEAGYSARTRLIVGWVVMLLGMAVLWFNPHWLRDYPPLPTKLEASPLIWSYMWLALAGLISLRPLIAIANPHPQLVQLAVVQSLRSLIILDAVVCYSVRDAAGAVMILVLIIPSLLLGRWVYST